jgi:hypothetical protein
MSGGNELGFETEEMETGTGTETETETDTETDKRKGGDELALAAPTRYAAIPADWPRGLRT